MRNILIVVAAVIGLVLVGLGVREAWRAVSGGGDTPYDQLTTTGKLTGSARDEFIAQGIEGCMAKRPNSVSADAFRQFCSCAMNKVADVITPDEAKAAKNGNSMPDSLSAKMNEPIKQWMNEPIKQCLKAAGLMPAQ